MIRAIIGQLGKLRPDDPEARYGERPDTYEIDVATSGDDPNDSWAVEAKHRRGAITVAMVERLFHSVDVVEQAHAMRFARRWMVAPRGIRQDALTRLRAAGALASGLRQIERLERELAEPLSPIAVEPRDGGRTSRNATSQAE